MSANTFGINTSTGYVEGETKRITVTVTNGRVTLVTDESEVWTKAEYDAYVKAQEKKESK